MWWCKPRIAWRRLAPLAVVLASASLTAGCFEPLYGSRPSVDAESVRDKLAAVEIPPIAARQGTPEARLAVEMRNDLQFDFNGGAGANAPTHRLNVVVSSSQTTVIVDATSGRPTAQIDGVTASYQLVEIATGKVVVNDSVYAHVDYDVPGPEQRFAKQRAQRNAEDHAVETVAESVRNRLASFFVAGT